MSGIEFSATVHQVGELPVVEFHGDINAFAEEAMNEAYEEAERMTSGPIAFSFAKVDYINSTGIALIVSLLARARKAKRTIRATGLNEHYREIFTITRLSDFMEME